MIEAVTNIFHKKSPGSERILLNSSRLLKTKTIAFQNILQSKVKHILLNHTKLKLYCGRTQTKKKAVR